MATGRVPTTANSPLTAKGDLFGYSTTQARVAVGNDGETLVADSSTSTGLRYNPQNALANPVINGGMDIWQRGTSFTYGGGIPYNADRWFTYRDSTGFTISRQTTSDTTNLPNIQYANRVQRTAGDTSTNTIYLAQSFESVTTQPFIGKTVTMSFYARRGANYSSASNILIAGIDTGTGTDQNNILTYTGYASAGSVNTTLTTTWQRFVLTATIATTVTEMGVRFFYTPSGTAGANDWFEVTGIQIDLGTYTASSAPTFRRAGGTIQGELAACQRYYWRNTVSAGGALMLALGRSTTVADWTIPYPIVMRRNPTAVEYGGTWDLSDPNVNSYTMQSIAFINANTYNAFLQMTTTANLAQGKVYLVGNQANAYVGFSAEL
jgi:hypothetical protein